MLGPQSGPCTCPYVRCRHQPSCCRVPPGRGYRPHRPILCSQPVPFVMPVTPFHSSAKTHRQFPNSARSSASYILSVVRKALYRWLPSHLHPLSRHGLAPVSWASTHCTLTSLLSSAHTRHVPTFILPAPCPYPASFPMALTPSQTPRDSLTQYVCCPAAHTTTQSPRQERI